VALVSRPQPYSGLNFEVTVDGISPDGTAVGATFQECGGLVCNLAVLEYRSGADPLNVIKIPGLAKYDNISLKWGSNGTALFWNWIFSGINGQVQRANGAIKLLDENRVEVMRWSFFDGWPTKYTGPSFNAATGGIAVEAVEIAHRSLKLETA
jgi:phage tail-like protein